MMNRLIALPIRSVGRLAFAAALLAASAAMAQDAPKAPTLRAEVTVSSDLVRLGDLIDGLPATADEAVFRSPDLGTTGTVQASRVVDAAHQQGVALVDTQGLSEVAVSRASRTVTLDEMRRTIALAISRQNGLGSDAALTLTFDPGTRNLHIEPNLTTPLEVTDLSWNAATGRFDAALGVGGSRVFDRFPARVGGNAIETAMVPVYSRAMSRGEVIHAADVVMDRLPRSDSNDGAIGDVDLAIGQAVRRAVRPGQPVMSTDLTKPEIVTRNDDITLTYTVPGMVLTVRGKALESGASGDMITVLNPQSKRVLQATITSPGRVAVMSDSSVASLN